MAINDRFTQPSYDFFCTIEQLLIKAFNSEPYQTELDSLGKYQGDVGITVLPTELVILRIICSNDKVSHFEEIKKIKKPY